MLAISGLLDKKLILADEPTSALDAESAQRVMAYFHELKANGTAIFIISHDAAFTSGCDKIITL